MIHFFAGLIALFMASNAYATHELDHRVTFVGIVYSEDGTPVPEATIELRDPALPEPLATTKTTAIGAFMLVGHLHDADNGRRLELVTGQRRHVFLVSFDPANHTRERVQRVDLGQAKQQELIRPFLGVAGILALVAIYATAKKRASSPETH